ncbi:g6f-like [Pungitius pungitius]|uniref:g6f-like n=1 Tax=Pungitius pungitius TaxID=134920 RepID=UPI002E12F16C
MDSVFLAIILVSTSEVYSSHAGITDWEDAMVVREGVPTTLVCTDTSVSGAVAINWRVKSLGVDEWKLVLSASENKKFSGGASKASMKLIDPNFQHTGVFSLFLLPTTKDSGLYSCLIKQRERKEKEKIILLAVLKVTVAPAAPIPQLSTLRLTARVNPSYAITKITWATPRGISMKSVKTQNTDTVAKVPLVKLGEGGDYVCTVRLWGNTSNTAFVFNVNVIIDENNLAKLSNITYETEISTATQAQTPFLLTCPGVRGDYVRLYWQRSDKSGFVLVYKNDSWGGSTSFAKPDKRLQLAGPPYDAESGSFAFLLIPELKDSGRYSCEVFLDDVVSSRITMLSVLKVKTRQSSSKLELVCLYSEPPQVKRANWKYQNKSRQLSLIGNSPGSIILPLPITSDTAGNYTCTIQLENGQTAFATQVVQMPHEPGRDVEGVSVTTPSLLPSLSALLLLVPLVAAAVFVLLWRQKRISDRGIEQSLSVYSREVENVYENPDDIRQAPPQGSVYMDLKPRGEDDVYKELERY